MKPRRERTKRVQVMHLWNWSEVSKAIPYLRSVICSLREHWLEVLRSQRQIDKPDSATGPVKRQHMIAMQAHQDDRGHAQTKFDDTLEELNRLNVYLLDPVRGLVLIPFRKGDELAWYVFDTFASRAVIGWRFHNDPIDECRPLEEEALVNDPSAA